MSARPVGSAELNGLRVLVTRPQPQADRLVNTLVARGARAVAMPMVEIQPCHEVSAQALQHELKHCHKVVVVSIPAVQQAFAHHPEVSESIRWFTPGAGTARTLAEFGVCGQYPQTGFTSEALLALPALQNVRGDRILLLKGEGGRDVIAETLRSRGAELTELALYRRVCPDYSAAQLESTMVHAAINAIVATSGQILTNLLSCCRDAACITGIPLLVPSARLARQAKEQGFTQVLVSAGAGDDDMVKALHQLAPTAVLSAD